jgi:hypothetical protein
MKTAARPARSAIHNDERRKKMLEVCEICEGRPVCRVVDLGDRIVRVCAACSAQLRADPELLLAAVRDAYDDDIDDDGEEA